MKPSAPATALTIRKRLNHARRINASSDCNYEAQAELTSVREAPDNQQAKQQTKVGER